MVKLHGAVLPKLTSFPTSPSDGRLAFVNDALYVYTTVDGLDSWYPMTNRTKRHIHGQPTSATNWVITHNLGTQQLVVICYDASGNLITPSNITYDSDNQITVTHSVSRTGDCAIFIDMAEELAVATGFNDKIAEGNSSLEVIDTGTGQIVGTTDGNDVFNLTDTLQRIGKDLATKIEVDQTGTITLDGTTIAVDGNITVTGTVDGRNVASDGSKLDGIEIGAGAVAGSNQQVQYNDNGSFGGSDSLTFNGTNLFVGPSVGNRTSIQSGVIGIANTPLKLTAGSEGFFSTRSYVEIENNGGVNIHGTDGSIMGGSNDPGQDVTLLGGTGEGTGAGGNVIFTPGSGNTDGIVQANGDMTVTGNVTSASPTGGSHLTTKDYVDGLISGLDWQESVLDKDLNDPPGSPSTGDRYLVSTAPPTATGAWLGHDNEFAEWNGSSWDFTSVTEGAACWVEDEDILYTYNGTSWVQFGATSTHNNLSGLNDGDYKHLTAAEYTDLTDAGVTSLHTHEIDTLYNSGNKRLETSANGIYIRGPSGYTGEINLSASNMYIKNYSNGGPVHLQGENTGGTEVTFLYGNPNGHTYIYDQGKNVIQTAMSDGTYGGLGVYSSDGYHTSLHRYDGQPGVTQLVDGPSGDVYLKGTPSGAVELNHGGSKSFETQNDGIKVYDTNATNNAIFAVEADGDLVIRENTWGRKAEIQGYDGTGNLKNVFLGWAGGNSNLYYDGNVCLKTDEDGIRVYDTDGDDVRLEFWSSAGVEQALLQTSNTDLYLDNRINEGLTYIRGKNTSGGTVNLASFDPDDNSALYGKGTKLLETLNTSGVTGIRVFNNQETDADSLGIYAADGASPSSWNISGVTNGADLRLLAYDDGGTQRNLFVGDPDGSVDLYYDGIESFRTRSGGYYLWDTNGTYSVAHYIDTGGSEYIYNQAAGSRVILYGLNASSSARYLICHYNTLSLYPGNDNAWDLGLSSNRWDDIYATNNVIQTSDERIKENIVASDLGLDFINDLNPISYKFKDYDYDEVDPMTEETVSGSKSFHRTHYGLIAQEVETVLTGLGKTTEQFAGFVYDSDSDRYSLRYGEFIGPIIKSVQELSATVVSQQTVIDDLTSRIEALEA